VIGVTNCLLSFIEREYLNPQDVILDPPSLIKLPYNVIVFPSAEFTGWSSSSNNKATEGDVAGSVSSCLTLLSPQPTEFCADK